MEITRLGQNVDETHLLAQDAIDRTLDVLARYRRLMDEAVVADARMVATSAARDAKNSDSFLVPASAAIGVPAEVLDGITEAEIACSGALHELSPAQGDDYVVDIGGGSTELAVRHQGVVRAISLDIGCVRVTERFFRADPPSEDEVNSATSFIASTVRQGLEELPVERTVAGLHRLVGLAGTVTTLAALELGLDHYDAAKIHHFQLERTAVDYWCKVLAAETTSERARRGAVIAGREDVILGGALILREVMKGLRFERCLASEADILDGLAMSLLK